MGLDMYLYAESRISGKGYFGKIYSPRLEEIAKLTNLVTLSPQDERPLGHMTVSVCVAYWRKANAIHGWFVQNVQGGVGECRRSDVETAHLVQLRETCQRALEYYDEGRLDAAAKLLPPQGGFFFGGTDIDEWYAENLRLTIRQIDPLIKAHSEGVHAEFYYRSSW